MRSNRWAGWRFVGLATVVLVAGCAAETTTPAVAPSSVTPEAPAATATPTSIPAPPSPIAAATKRPPRSIAPVLTAPTAPPELPAALVGAWAGTATNAGGLWGSTVPLTYVVTLDACALGEPCGRLRASGIDSTGAETGCTWPLTYVGLAVLDPYGTPQQAQTTPWMVFAEGPMERFAARFPGCSGGGQPGPGSCRDYFRPLPDGTVEQTMECAGGWQHQAILHPAGSSGAPSGG